MLWDIWLGLLGFDEISSDDNSLESGGGVLLSSVLFMGIYVSAAPDTHISVDRDGLLRYPFLEDEDEEPESITRLEHEQWCNLAVVYEQAQHQQRVYLDGDLVSMRDGELHCHFRSLFKCVGEIGWRGGLRGVYNSFRYFVAATRSL